MFDPMLTTPTRRDWLPVTTSLFTHLDRYNLRVIEVDDQQERIAIDPMPPEVDTPLARIEKAALACDGLDACRVTLHYDPDGHGHSFPSGQAPVLQLVLIYGNEPHELVADWLHSSGDAFEELCERAIDAFCREWETKPCPRIPE